MTRYKIQEYQDGNGKIVYGILQWNWWQPFWIYFGFPYYTQTIFEDKEKAYEVLDAFIYEENKQKLTKL